MRCVRIIEKEVLLMKKISVPGLAWAITAWDMLMDIPVPRFVRKLCSAKSVTHMELAHGFVLVGIFTGVVFALVSTLLSISWINKYVAAGIFAVAAAVVCELKDSGRGLRLLISAISRKLSGEGWIDSVLDSSAQDGSFEKSSGSISALLITFIEVGCFGLLSYFRAAWWCVAVFAGAYTIQMLLATLPRTLGNEPFIKIAPDKKMQIWIFPAVIGVLSILFFPAAGIVGAVIVGGLGQIVHKNFQLTGTPVTADVITLCGKLTEIILLLCGIIFVL